MNKIYYDKIVLMMINNKVLSDGIIDEETKRNIDRQIEEIYK